MAPRQWMTEFPKIPKVTHLLRTPLQFLIAFSKPKISNHNKNMTQQKVTVVSGSGDKQRKNELSLDENATVKDLKASFAKAAKKDINRVSFKAGTDGKIRLDDDSKSLKSYELGENATITFKDLGPQIGYRTVFVVEYLGPMLFVLFYAMRPSFLYGAHASDVKYNWVAKLGVICWVAHFMKREFETFFIHKFSRPTMPMSNLFKNCAYYWTFGAVIGYPLCKPSYVAPGNLHMIYLGLAIFVLSELGNFAVHYQLSNMRPAEGSTKREIPKGFLFNFVACPNYTFEVMSWVGFSLMTGLIFSWLFTLVGFLQMTEWAIKKHKEYKKKYDKEYTKLGRKAIVPFVL
jgi:very-long-chain enoyl-CoA reductase